MRNANRLKKNKTDLTLRVERMSVSKMVCAFLARVARRSALHRDARDIAAYLYTLR
jgi:hypothetical protein